MYKKIKNPVIFAADLETVVDENPALQTQTEAWLSGFCELFTEDCHAFGDLWESVEYLTTHKKVKKQEYVVLYYHNEKFDGSFFLAELFKRGFDNGFECGRKYKSKYDLNDYEMMCRISSKGQWYEIAFKYKGILFDLKDSLKLLPFSIRKIAKDFKTKHQKLEMEYKNTEDHKRYAGCEVTKEEMEYFKNDIYVLKEALEFMYSQGHDKLTIGGCCLAEYKELLKNESLIGNEIFDMYGDLLPSIVKETIEDAKWNEMFPNLTDIKLDPFIFGYENADEYIRKSYRGGWCYQVAGKEGLHYNGLTCDVNSLYPSVMHSDSGSRYPVGLPHFWSGVIPAEAQHDNRYYFVRIRCRFKLKKDYLPWLQIKGDLFYDPTECLTDSDFTVFDKENKQWIKTSRVCDREARPVLTLTKLDYELLKMHYNVYDEEVLDGCWFESQIGIFDTYINKWAQIKMTSKGAVRQLAKLFLNNLYGKLATSPDSSYKVPYLREDGIIGFDIVVEREKETVYIAAGSAITSYAKNFTIRTAQKNYHGVDKAGFIYADTDSIHCGANTPDEAFTPDMLVDVPVHPTAFNHWKVESSWDVGMFVRQKTYIEHVTHEDLEPIENPYYNVKCAGLPDKCKDLFVRSLEGKPATEEEIKSRKLTPEAIEFISKKRELTDFKVGLKVPCKLKPKRIIGGIVLVDEWYTMH